MSWLQSWSLLLCPPLPRFGSSLYTCCPASAPLSSCCVRVRACTCACGGGACELTLVIKPSPLSSLFCLLAASSVCFPLRSPSFQQVLGPLPPSELSVSVTVFSVSKTCHFLTQLSLHYICQSAFLVPSDGCHGWMSLLRLSLSSVGCPGAFITHSIHLTPSGMKACSQDKFGWLFLFVLFFFLNEVKST